jgi:hypothetical protein
MTKCIWSWIANGRRPQAWLRVGRASESPLKEPQTETQGSPMVKQAEMLHEILSGDEMIVAPGAYDCLTARLVEQARFPAVYMTGAGVSASLGYPDYGLTP